jgi:hypothetical protein
MRYLPFAIGDLSLKDIRGGAAALTLRDVSAWLLVRCHCRNARLAIRLLSAVLFCSGLRGDWLPGLAPSLEHSSETSG